VRRLLGRVVLRIEDGRRVTQFRARSRAVSASTTNHGLFSVEMTTAMRRGTAGSRGRVAGSIGRGRFARRQQQGSRGQGNPTVSEGVREFHGVLGGWKSRHHKTLFTAALPTLMQLADPLGGICGR
jgi:hypothetical protein